jgi:hypothetical protein
MFLRKLVENKGDYKASRSSMRPAVDGANGYLVCKWYAPYDVERRATVFYKRLKDASSERMVEAYNVASTHVGTDVADMVYWYLDTLAFPEGISTVVHKPAHTILHTQTCTHTRTHTHINTHAHTDMATVAVWPGNEAQAEACRDMFNKVMDKLDSTVAVTAVPYLKCFLQELMASVDNSSAYDPLTRDNKITAKWTKVHACV